MFLSVFELFKIGIGPSSSHTVGPMVAAGMFLDEIVGDAVPMPTGTKIDRITVSLHGSLAFTGKGHASDRAVLLGLAGEKPEEIDPSAIPALVQRITAERAVHPHGHPAYRFDPQKDLIFDYDRVLPGHSNGMMFTAFNGDGLQVLQRVYYSIGGGFVVEEDAIGGSCPPTATSIDVPHPFSNAGQMLEMANQSGVSIAELQRRNEAAVIEPATISYNLQAVWKAMDDCMKRGIALDGELPGGLFVKRRAKHIHDQLVEEWKDNRSNPVLANDWLTVYAMAVNEENAAGGKVVTAPTNGAAGVIPAVIKYYLHFYEEANPADIENFLLTAGAIGSLIKANASISGAEVGCQGEVGSAAAMAAAGLVGALGGTPAQVENAAEIALEHHLGMTCDPVAGLVQVPCIERNGLGAVKAVTAASLAMKGDGSHFVSLDACIETMRQTGHDMSERYKETSQGGLAVNTVAC